MRGYRGDDVVYGGLDPSFPDTLNVPDDAGEPEPDNGDDSIRGYYDNDLIDVSSMGLTFVDIFLSQDDSVTVIQAEDTTIRHENTDLDDMDETAFVLRVSFDRGRLLR